MIEVTGLVKRYGSHVAVDHLSFQVETGQIYGFLGPNGAGKSTTMNILTGYLCANEGTVVINGYDIFKEPEKAKKQIGYLPELPPLYLDMTAEEYLLFTAELKKIPKAERKKEAEKVMLQTDILDVKERLIRNLSKGYRQRVGLAQALLGSPEIIILDEPTVGLDPKQIIEIRDLIKELGKKHTVILSSHILSEVSAVCDEIMILSRGRLVAKDTPENLSRLMEGKRTLQVTVCAPKEEVENELKELSEIESYKIEEEEVTLQEISETESGEEVQKKSRVEIETEADVDIREKLFYLMAQKRMPIIEMGIQKASLEDVFMELTSKEEVAES
ncbi:MAG: ABC transporter ATP-binding protein [Lachnospiraceae bacterium]